MTLSELFVGWQMALRAPDWTILRALWRAGSPSLNEFPALLESLLPPTPAVLLPPVAALHSDLPACLETSSQPESPIALSPAATQEVASDAVTCPPAARTAAKVSHGRSHAPVASGIAVRSDVEL